MSFGPPAIFKAMYAAERSALTAQADCSRGEAAYFAVARCGGGFAINKVRQQIVRAADNLGMMPTPKPVEHYLILDGKEPHEIQEIFSEMRRTINLLYKKKRK